MNNINDGGSAFPYNRDVSNAQEWQEVEGMTLRDYFAGQALSNIAIDYSCKPAALAQWAYCLADAMIEQRDE